MKLNYNRFFFHFTEMQISTHIKFFLRFKLKLVTLVTCCSIEFFCYLILIFLLLFYITQHYPPSVCPFTLNPLPPPPNVTCSGGGGFRGGGCSGGGGVGCLVQMGVGAGGGWVQVGGGFKWGEGVGSSGGRGVVQVVLVVVGGLGRAFRWGVQWGEGSKGANVRGIEGEQRGKRWAGGGGQLNGTFLQFEFRFWNGLGQAVHSLCKVSASLT